MKYISNGYRYKKVIDSVLHIYYILPLFLLSCLAFNSENGKHFISRIVVVMFIIAVCTDRQGLLRNINKIRKILFFWLSMVIFFAAFHLFRGESFSLSRTILVSIIYLAIVPWSKISRQLIIFTILLGGCVSGIVGFYEHEVLNVERVGGVVNQIPFSLYVSITLLIAIHTVWDNKNNYMKLLACLTVIGSAFAIIMSEVRGIWLALLCIAVAAIWYQSQRVAARGVIITGIIFLTILTMFSAVSDVSKRIDETKQEFIQISNGNKNTSIGIRLQLWYSAIDMIKNHPLMGVGTQRYQSLMEQQYQQGMISSTAFSFRNSHVHNQYIDSYIRYGIIGVIMVLAIFVSANYLYTKQGVGVNNLCSSMTLTYLIAGLTDVPLMHTGVIYMLVIYPAVICLPSISNDSIAFV